MNNKNRKIDLLNGKVIITIFTPTYNRAHTLPALYESLCSQRNQNFEWLVIDDGSTDNTHDLFDLWLKENKVKINYYKVTNAGKHIAINKGLSLAKGELFFIVDSDDILMDNATEIILEKYQDIRNDDKYCGLAGSRATPDGKRIGGDFKYNFLDCSALDFRLRYNIRGDMAEVFKTKILKLYPFPSFKNEKFCPEALIWNRIAKRYVMRFMPTLIYITEYLPDGLTSKISKLRYDSPKASMLYYSELFNSKISFKHKIKASINFWRFNPTYSQKSYNMRSIMNLFCMPIGKIIRLRERK